MKSSPMRLRSQLRRFLESQASSGLILMAAAAVALVVANSPLRFSYEQTLAAYVGPLSLAHWINDGLMAVFFLLVGLEIKREVVEGQLSTWSRRILPGTAALGGMAVPAVVYLAFAGAVAPDGWAIPAATDIAFALGVLALLGDRVPVSLRIFLTALAIIDDLGAVAIIAFFYTSGLSLPALGGAGLVMVALVAMNRFGVRSLPLYLIGGLILWAFVLRSGIHATLAGVLLAMTIPLGKDGPAQRLEHALHLPVSFIILPIFGLANAGVSVIGLSSEALVAPVTLGVALGLLVGKLVGVFAFSMIAVGLGLADMPKGAGRWQMLGLALLCGIGFTMSLFITPLAFPGDLILQAEAKIGILAGSVASGLLGWTLLRIVGPTRAT